MSLFRRREPEPCRALRQMHARRVWFMYVFDPNRASPPPKVAVPSRTLFKVEGALDTQYMTGHADLYGRLERFMIGNLVQRGVPPFFFLMSCDEITFRLATLDFQDRCRKNGLVIEDCPPWWAPAWEVA